MLDDREVAAGRVVKLPLFRRYDLYQVVLELSLVLADKYVCLLLERGQQLPVVSLFDVLSNLRAAELVEVDNRVGEVEIYG